MATSGKSRRAVVGSRLPRKSVCRPVGVIRSVLKDRSKAPRQGAEGAPDAWLDVYAWRPTRYSASRPVTMSWSSRGCTRRGATCSRCTRGQTRVILRVILSPVFLPRDPRTGPIRWACIRWSCVRSRATGCASDL